MGPAIRIGLHPAAWASEALPGVAAEPPAAGLLAEAARIGYAGVELGAGLPQEPEPLRAALRAHGLACPAGAWAGSLWARTPEEEVREAEPRLRLLQAAGAEVLVYLELHGSVQRRREALHRRPRPRDHAAWRAYGERLTDLARRVQARGLRLAYHPHAGALVETAEDVERLLAATGDEVGLALDTGHAALAGDDPVALIERHAARLRHVHAKDLRPAVARLARNGAWSFPEAVLNGVFTVPGDGGLDFGPIVSVLGRRGYRGWLVVEAEQDPAVAPPGPLAEKGYRHLAGLVRSLAPGPREHA